MAAGSWSSSSCTLTSSLGSDDDDDVVFVTKPGDDPSAAAEGNSVKFLCSYGGMILPRHSDGALRYVGGNNRVLSVDRSLHFYELQRKLRDMCGCGEAEVSLRCQLPTEDLDTLVSVASKEDLGNLMEEYDAASRDRLQPLKIRAFLFPRPPTPPPLSPSSTPSPRPRPAHVRHHQHYHMMTRSPAAARQHHHRRPHRQHAVHNGIQLQ